MLVSVSILVQNQDGSDADKVVIEAMKENATRSDIARLTKAAVAKAEAATA